MELVLLAWIALAGSQCPPDNEESPPEVPTVAAVEVVPSTAHTMAGIGFEARARLWDAAGSRISEAYAALAPQWNWTSYTVDGIPGDLSTLPVPQPGFATSVTTPTTTGVAVVLVLRATAEARFDELSIRLGDVAADRVEADQVTGGGPAVAIVDGLESACVNDRLVAFVGAGPVGSLRGDCSQADAVIGEAAVFFADRQPVFTAVPWTSGADVLDLRTNQESSQGARDPLEVPAAFWVPTVADGQPEAQIVAEVEVVNGIFSRNGAGLRIVPTEISTAELESVVVPGAAWDCADLQRQMQAQGVPASAFGPLSLNVFYVLAIVDEPMEEGAPVSYAGYRGYACPAVSGSRGAAVIIAWDDRAPSTLAHELGHVFGLSASLPEGGHSRGYGFKSNNVMWTTLHDNVAASRDHLSLGQMFRMAFDERSWISIAVRKPAHPAAGLTCQCDPHASVPCPPATLDVRPIGGLSWKIPSCP